MNSKTKHIPDSNKLSNLLEFKSNKEKITLQEELLHLKFISAIEKEMRSRNIAKSELAKLLGTSRSFISQLFTGDKMINIKTLNKIQSAFDISFNINIVNNRKYHFDIPNCEHLKNLRRKELLSKPEIKTYKLTKTSNMKKEKFTA